MNSTLAERLWSRVDKQDAGLCWEWQGYRMKRGTGHGQISDGTGRPILTHRVAWTLANGPIPEGLVVRHKCDNPPCVNPAHLELGTIADNIRDSVERGRNARGFRLPQTRLSSEDAEEVRRSYRRFTVPGQRGYRSNARELGRRYGVTAHYITDIVARKERA